MERALTLVLSVVCLGCLSCGLIGCDSGDRNLSSKGDTTQQPPASAGAGGNMMGGSTTSGAPTSGAPMAGGSMAGQQPPDVKPIKESQETYDKTKKAFAAAPKDEKAKKAFVDASNDLADSYMFAKGLSPKEMYPNALKYYREAAKADPANQKAKGNIDLILSIYKSMGKTPPAEGG